MKSITKPLPQPSLEPPSLLVRNFRDSNVIGFHPQPPSSPSSSLTPSSNVPQDEPRVISCDFQMKIPTNALRIDMSIRLSTKRNRNDCEDNPSVAYKITICTPRRDQEDKEETNGSDNNGPKYVTTTTLKWSSKFTIAKGNEDRNIFHHWNGSFVLGEKKYIDISECEFHQVKGIFGSNNACPKPIAPLSFEGEELQERKTKKNHADDDSRLLPERKRRRKNPIDSKDQPLALREQQAVLA